MHPCWRYNETAPKWVNGAAIDCYFCTKMPTAHMCGGINDKKYAIVGRSVVECPTCSPDRYDAKVIELAPFTPPTLIVGPQPRVKPKSKLEREQAWRDRAITCTWVISRWLKDNPEGMFRERIEESLARLYALDYTAVRRLLQRLERLGIVEKRKDSKYYDTRKL